jgi:hypothetical protein
MLNKNINSILVASSSLDEQYSLKKILLIWISSALPMAILAFVITPALIPMFDLPPLIIYWLAINLGLIWQFVLSIIILKKDGHYINWSTIQKRMWFQKPRNPKTGKSNN